LFPAVICVFGNVTVFKLCARLNILDIVDNDADTVEGSVTVVMLAALKNIPDIIVQALILVGNVTDVNERQLLKRLSAVVTEFIVEGNVTVRNI
jgi:hypothetical protein